MNEEQRKKDMEIFETEVKIITEKLPNHKIKEFTLSNLEQQMLAEQQTIIDLAQNSQIKIINELVLKRIAIIPSPAIHVRYSIGLGRFVVFIPILSKTKKN
jgi:hypothetical protein